MVRDRKPSELRGRKAVWEGRLGRETMSRAHSSFRIEGTAVHAGGDSGEGERK